VLFPVRFHAGILSGAIAVTYRTWSSPHVKPGGRYRFGLRHQTNDYLVVDSIETVTLSSLRESHARSAGFNTLKELKETVKRYQKPGDHVYRITFHYDADQEDPRVALRYDLSDLAPVVARLRRMGSWTGRVLSLIAQQPRVAASRLAPSLDQETLPFKADVRKLKALGLTISHPVGYELSPRGRAVLDLLAPASHP
jgi:uncharacterized protein YqfB (UPF0267 family)